MNSHLLEWLAYFTRWAHVIAGIAWIGNSFYFMWLDSNLEVPNPPKEGVEGSLWMVHSGGFYSVERRRIRPNDIPPTLHWFFWEATLTLITGFFLLAMIYYWRADAFLIDPSVWAISQGVAIAVSIGCFIASWFIYDLFWRSPLGKRGRVSVALAMPLLAGFIYGLCHLFSGRGAFIHVGAIIGMIMVINVWVHILPTQRKMIAATKEGRLPNYDLSMIAKSRSVQNSYLTLPVLFTMLGNHQSEAYSHPQNWLVLILLFGFGFSVRHAMILRNKKQTIQYAVSMAVGFLVALLAVTWPKAPNGTDADRGAMVEYSTVRAIVDSRCVSCHSAHNSDPVWKIAPKGVTLETYEGLKKNSAQVRIMAVVTKIMPLANQTRMTEEERKLLGRWIDAGSNGP